MENKQEMIIPLPGVEELLKMTTPELVKVRQTVLKYDEYLCFLIRGKN
jgi:hypothetical protein